MERKLATVLFADLVSSTELLAGQDPEITRRRVTSFFDGVQRCIENHGGTVEKFAGDAVMAAFGIPIAHEDDADRAVRAGLGILDHVRDLGLEARGGIETVSAGPLELRGFRNPIEAYRAIAARDGQPHSKVSAPFVGRESELDLLENTLARTIRDRRPHVFTVYGEPGVGKSRLIREFLAGVEGATILSGRALPYGEGVTYWPLAEMVKAAAGITDDDPMETAKQKLIECCGDEAIAELLGLASGVMEAVEGQRGAPEIAWAAREFADELADVQPLVMVFEDIHWAEEPLLEEHRVTGKVRARLLDKTEGNPLFVEETVRMLVEEGAEGGDRIPDSLQAMIGARIDRLPAGAKIVLQRGSVIGRTFWAGAIDHLSPEYHSEEVEDILDDLLLRDFVTREERSTITGEAAYRFKHVLIREVAYGGLSKSGRAEYHTRFAEWLREKADKELLEIRAYHLDQACLLYAELDGHPPVELARMAA